MTEWTIANKINCLGVFISVIVLIISASLFVSKPITRLEVQMEVVERTLQQMINREYVTRSQYEQDRREFNELRKDIIAIQAQLTQLVRESR